MGQALLRTAGPRVPRVGLQGIGETVFDDALQAAVVHERQHLGRRGLRVGPRDPDGERVPRAGLHAVPEREELHVQLLLGPGHGHPGVRGQQLVILHDVGGDLQAAVHRRGHRQGQHAAARNPGRQELVADDLSGHVHPQPDGRVGQAAVDQDPRGVADLRPGRGRQDHQGQRQAPLAAGTAGDQPMGHDTGPALVVPRGVDQPVGARRGRRHRDDGAPVLAVSDEARIDGGPQGPRGHQGRAEGIVMPARTQAVARRGEERVGRGRRQVRLLAGHPRALRLRQRVQGPAAFARARHPVQVGPDRRQGVGDAGGQEAVPSFDRRDDGHAAHQVGPACGAGLPSLVGHVDLEGVGGDPHPVADRVRRSAGDERHGEDARGVGRGAAFGDDLAAAVPRAPAAPGLDVAPHPPNHRRPRDRQAEQVVGLAFQFVRSRRDQGTLGVGQAHFERGALVLLHADDRLAVGLGGHRPPAAKAVRWQLEGPRGRAEVVGQHRLLRHRLPVGVLQPDGHAAGRGDVQVGPRVVAVVGHHLPVHGLAGPVHGPVGEDERAPGQRTIRIPPGADIVQDGRLVAPAHEDVEAPASARRKPGPALGVAARGRNGRFARVRPVPQHDVGTGHRRAVAAGPDLDLDLLLRGQRRHQQAADQHAHRLHVHVSRGRIRRRRRRHQVVAGRAGGQAGPGVVVSVVGGRRQLQGPGQVRRPRRQRVDPVVRRGVVAGVPAFAHVEAPGQEMQPRRVPVPHEDGAPIGRIDGLGLEGKRWRLDLFAQRRAQAAAYAVGVPARPLDRRQMCPGQRVGGRVIPQKRRQLPLAQGPPGLAGGHLGQPRLQVHRDPPAVVRAVPHPVQAPQVLQLRLQGGARPPGGQVPGPQVGHQAGDPLEGMHRAVGRGGDRAGSGHGRGHQRLQVQGAGRVLHARRPEGGVAQERRLQVGHHIAEGGADAVGIGSGGQVVVPVPGVLVPAVAARPRPPQRPVDLRDEPLAAPVVEGQGVGAGGIGPSVDLAAVAPAVVLQRPGVVQVQHGAGEGIVGPRRRLQRPQGRHGFAQGQPQVGVLDEGPGPILRIAMLPGVAQDRHGDGVGRGKAALLHVPARVGPRRLGRRGPRRPGQKVKNDEDGGSHDHAPRSIVHAGRWGADTHQVGMTDDTGSAARCHAAMTQAPPRRPVRVP